MSTGIKPIMPATHTAITTKRENTPAFTKSRTLNLFTYKTSISIQTPQKALSFLSFLRKFYYCPKDIHEFLKLRFSPHS